MTGLHSPQGPAFLTHHPGSKFPSHPEHTQEVLCVMLSPQDSTWTLPSTQASKCYCPEPASGQRPRVLPPHCGNQLGEHSVPQFPHACNGRKEDISWTGCEGCGLTPTEHQLVTTDMSVAQDERVGHSDQSSGRQDAQSGTGDAQSSRCPLRKGKLEAPDHPSWPPSPCRLGDQPGSRAAGILALPVSRSRWKCPFSSSTSRCLLSQGILH